MARSYARIATSIWSDEHFQKLSLNAQRLYLVLVSQPTITPAGTLAVTMRKWANYCGEDSTSGVEDALAELADNRFVVVDWDTEELLVRTFVKWDGGASNEKRQTAIRDALTGVQSRALLGVLAVELTRAGVPRHGLECPTDSPSDAASDTPSYAPSDTRGVVVTEVGSTPQPTTHQPQPATRAPAPQHGGTRPTFDEFWAIYPRRTGKRGANAEWDRAVKRAEPTAVLAGAARYRDDPNREAEFTKHPSTWLHNDCWDDDPLPARNGGRPPPMTATEKAQGWLDAGQQARELIARSAEQHALPGGTR